MAIWAIVVAGGVGTRFGGQKQFMALGGRPVVQWALNAACASVDRVVLVVPIEGSGSLDNVIKRHELQGFDHVVAGGPTRSASVREGLAVVPYEATIIVVHDAARPLASPALFASVIQAVTDGADAAVCAVPVTDTLKEVDESGTVVRTVDRASMRSVQTPQAFRADVLRQAHAGAESATDDAALVEAAGGKVLALPGDSGNVKLTMPVDFELAATLMASHGEGESWWPR